MPIPTLVHRLRLRSGDAPHERHVTWLELFYDLVFVVAVSQVATPLSEHYTLAGVLRFAVFFLLVWWAWLGHTVFATRFDTDDAVQRALTLIQVFIVALMGINAGGALDSRDSAGFAGAYAALRLVLVAQYARARCLREGRPLTTVYLVGCGTAALLWLVSALVPAPARFAVWGLAFVLDFATPIVAERYSDRVPPHPAHLPERFGLFTIILLGEAVVAVMEGMRSQEGWSVAAATTAFVSMAVLFGIWGWYFDGIEGARERDVTTRRDALRLRVWTYAHLPLFLGLALTGVGLEHTIRIAGGGMLHLSESLILAGALAAVMMAALVIWSVSPEDRPGAGRLAAGGAIVAVTLLAGALGPELSSPTLVLVLAAACAAQIAFVLATPEHLARWLTPRRRRGKPQPALDIQRGDRTQTPLGQA
jgi:low temperature requirement protein LtrA